MNENEPGPALPESRWTGPTDLCPHPDRWTSTDGDSTEVEVSALIGALVTALQPDVVVETGSAWGQTAEQIGFALVGRGTLWSIEPDPERAAYTRARCAGLPVVVLEQESLTFEPPAVIGFAFFDSLFHLRVPEFVAYRPMMRTGTIVAFHDSAPFHGDLPSGRDLRGEIEAELGGQLRFLHLPTPRGLTIGEVI